MTWLLDFSTYFLHVVLCCVVLMALPQRQTKIENASSPSSEALARIGQREYFTTRAENISQSGVLWCNDGLITTSLIDCYC